MSHERLSDKVRTFLDQEFPGSSMDEGYYFVTIEAPIRGTVRDDPFQLLERTVERICRHGCWAIVVGTDPRPYLRVGEADSREVNYRPDWNIEEPMTQWVVEHEGGGVELRSLLRNMTLVSAAVFIDSKQRVVVDAGKRRVYARSADELARFIEGIEDCIEL